MLKSLNAYRTSFSFLRKNGLLHFLWFPLIITALVVWGGLEATSIATNFIFDALHNWLNPDEWLAEDYRILLDVFYVILWLLLKILLYFLFAFIGGSIVLLLMSPALTWLSEKVAERMGGEAVSFSMTRFVNDLGRAILLALRNGLLQALLSIACFGIGLIPIVGFAAPFLLFAINAYFYGYNLMDYNLERYGMTARESQRFVWKHKFKALGAGGPYALWTLIPFIGPLTSGFIAVFGCVAATRVLEEERTKSQMEQV